MEQIILASQSPRRRKLLARMGVDFAVVPSNYDEHLDDSRDIDTVAIELSIGKAEDVSQKYPTAYIIGSDTIVGVDGKQLGKAETVDEAREMLKMLAGKESVVTTGVAVVNHALGIKITGSDTVRVYFRPDSPETDQLREEYLASEDWKDKAGAYGIQTVYGTLIERIDGDPSTVIGLPTHILANLLNDLGFDSAHAVTGLTFDSDGDRIT
jgi:septum formation protein